MPMSNALGGEFNDSKLAAIFSNPKAALGAAEHLKRALGLTSPNVEVILPGQPSPGRRLEPDDAGIERTLVRSHVRLGIAGALASAMVFAALYLSGVSMIVSSPLVALVAFVFLGGIAGLLLGGLVSLRPDHDPYVHRVLSSLGKGRAAVVVHVRDKAERERAGSLLEEDGGETVSTL